MPVIESLTEKHWQTIYAMAQMLANEETDPNELGKAVAYLRAYGDREKAGARFFEYLKTLVRNGKSVGHSQKTIDYYTSIEKACKQHLQSYQDDVPAMLQILGWVVRLMRYYKSGGSVADGATAAGTSGEPVAAARQVEIAKVVQAQKFEVRQILDATVTNIQGNKVTYEMLATIKLTQKEPKKYQDLSVGQMVKVEIVELKDDGSIKKVKCVD